jgi:hypothetical protein
MPRYPFRKPYWPSWGAEGVGVEGFEAGALGGEAVEVWGSVLFIAVAAELLGSEIISED